MIPPKPGSGPPKFTAAAYAAIIMGSKPALAAAAFMSLDPEGGIY